MREYIERITCDRCGWFEDVKPNKNTFTVLTLQREDKERHLCAACNDQFTAWWRAEAK